MSYFYKGPNPTVDLVLLTPGNEILLIKRGRDPYKGCWALPGGFQETEAKQGDVWAPGVETASEAAAREAREEAGVEVDPAGFVLVGVYEGSGRDPRDSMEAWSRSTVYYSLTEKLPSRAGDDAAEVGWFHVDSLPDLAFDHRRIIQDAYVKAQEKSHDNG